MFKCEYAWPSVTAPLPLLSRQYYIEHQCLEWDEEILGWASTDPEPNRLESFS